MAAKKNETYALIREHGWLVVDRVAGTKNDGKPWFIGPGIGFDVNRILVYADNETDAEEIAEEKWPERMGDKLTPEEEREADEEGSYTFFSKGHAWSPKDDRIFCVAQRIARGVPNGHGGATLTTGEEIRYK